ncbi:MAG: ABC transporter substrate-binding protein [Actinomycetota bacterium]
MAHKPIQLGRAVAALLAVALVAASCGSDSETETSSQSASASESASSSDSASESASASDSASAVSDEEVAEDEADGADDGETVTVVDATGEVTVPVTDAGVYALDEYAALALLSLEVEPVVVEAFFQDMTLAPVIESEGATLNPAGSVEAIAAAQPDLILGIGHPNSLEVRDQHLGIAPAAYPDFTVSWQEQLEVFAQATGRSDRGTEVIAAVEGKVAELQAALDEAGFGGQSVSIIQTFGPEYYAYGPTTLAGQLVAQLGFTRSEIQSGDGDFGFILVAEEFLIEETSSDINFGISGADSDFASVFDNPVVDVGDRPHSPVIDAWTGNHALAAWIILSDIESVLLGDGSVTTLDDVVERWGELEAAIDGAS